MRPSVQQPISKDKNVMVQTRKYYLKNHYLTLRKGQGPRKVIMIHDTPPYGHAPKPNIIDLSQKKQLFDLKVKGQCPNKGHYGMRHTSYGHAPTYQISTYLERQKMLWPEQENTI